MNSQDQHLKNIFFCLRTLTLGDMPRDPSLLKGHKLWEIRQNTASTDIQGHSLCRSWLTSNMVEKIFLFKCKMDSCYLFFWATIIFRSFCLCVCFVLFFSVLQAQLDGPAFSISSSIISLVAFAGRKLEAPFPPIGRKMPVQLTNCRLVLIWYKC